MRIPFSQRPTQNSHNNWDGFPGASHPRPSIGRGGAYSRTREQILAPAPSVRYRPVDELVDPFPGGLDETGDVHMHKADDIIRGPHVNALGAPTPEGVRAGRSRTFARL